MPHNKAYFNALLLLLLFTLASCITRRTATTHSTTQRDTLMKAQRIDAQQFSGRTARDSVIILKRDSIFLREEVRGDTVRIEKVTTLYNTRIQKQLVRDTIYIKKLRVDTIYKTTQRTEATTQRIEKSPLSIQRIAIYVIIGILLLIGIYFSIIK